MTMPMTNRSLNYRNNYPQWQLPVKHKLRELQVSVATTTSNGFNVPPPFWIGPLTPWPAHSYLNRLLFNS